MHIQDLNLLSYTNAWAIQQQASAAVLLGGEETILLVEHPPVITFGRRAEVFGRQNLLASAEALANIGVEVVQSDRGGDITFHGPGQLVVYPIIRLADRKLSVGSYVRLLQEAVISALAEMEIIAHRDDSAVGVWVGQGAKQEKICALGVRIRRGVSMHGLALNVTTDLSGFNLITPCGIADRGVTSLQRLLGERTPSMQIVKTTITRHLLRRLT